MTRRWLIGLVLVSGICGLAASSLWAEEAAAVAAAPTRVEDDEYYELFKVLADTFDQVERNYVHDLSRRELVEAAIEGVIRKLDPYSNYISPDDIDRFKTSVEQEFGGIGIQVDHRDGRLVITSPLYGTPAYRAGLHAGDAILAIDGKPVEELKVDEVVGSIKGEPGTSVTLTVLAKGAAEPKSLTIDREIVRLETVLGNRRKPSDAWDFMLDPERKIGYIRLTAFSRETGEHLRAALAELTAQEMKGLVFDLRFNGGGLLTSAIEVSDLFIAEGRIVSTKGRNAKEKAWEAEREGTFEGFPMAVLVNNQSASASEIVSACLQDHERAVVIGQRTYGKGSVQNIIELEGGKSALKLTTAGYLRPCGKNIDRAPQHTDADEWGVLPDDDCEVALSDDDLKALLIHWEERARIQPPPDAAPEATENEPAPEAAAEPADAGDPAATPAEAIDPQLQRALDYLNEKLAPM